MLAFRWKTDIKLFVNSRKYLYFLGQYRILPYLFVNTLLNGHSKGSRITKFYFENGELFV